MAPLLLLLVALLLLPGPSLLGPLAPLPRALSPVARLQPPLLPVDLPLVSAALLPSSPGLVRLVPSPGECVHDTLRYELVLLFLLLQLRIRRNVACSHTSKVPPPCVCRIFSSQTLSARLSVRMVAALVAPCSASEMHTRERVLLGRIARIRLPWDAFDRLHELRVSSLS